MNIRQYAETDRGAVLKLHQELQRFEWPLRALRSRSPRLSEEYFEREYDELLADEDCDCMFLVAEAEGDLVGYVFCLVDDELLDDPREQVQVLDIMVTESARRDGIGRGLMEAVNAFADERGVARITLDVLCTNVIAVSFYKSLGYEGAVLSMEQVRKA
ncbi:MAG: GNAT family N-acetyltransferase [Maricaulaceae bacterium]